jgi:hypothetical protein
MKKWRTTPTSRMAMASRQWMRGLSLSDIMGIRSAGEIPINCK